MSASYWAAQPRWGLMAVPNDGPEKLPAASRGTNAVEAAIRSRRSVRAYLNKPVPRETIEQILKLANLSPSGSNIQPWRVHVLSGKSLERLGTAMRQAYLDQKPGHVRDYAYYTEPLSEPFLARRRACGWGMYGVLDIKRGETEKIRAQRATNYSFFGAPLGLVFTINKKLERGSWIDNGAFLQNVMLLARSFGLHTCPQASIGEFPDIVRGQLESIRIKS